MARNKKTLNQSFSKKPKNEDIKDSPADGMFILHFFLAI